MEMNVAAGLGAARRDTRTGRNILAAPALLARASVDAVKKLAPRKLARNPVIFVTELVAILVSVLAVLAVARGAPFLFQAGIAAWLWLTVLFATFAEAVAEGRGRAQADSLRQGRGEMRAKLLARADDRRAITPRAATSGSATWCWWRRAT
jgi:K+-transporting ATPase ATPase B chain